MAPNQLVTDQDRTKYLDFSLHHLKSFGRAFNDEIWHYTTAEGLIGILKSGKIFATQVTCLNDNLEQRYFSDLVLAGVRRRRAKNTDPGLGILLRSAEDALSLRDFSAVGQFAACFSEIEDDLNQWRGYGGGECGYALGFRPQKIFDAINLRPPLALLLAMNYELAAHNLLVDDVLKWAEIYFLEGLSRGSDPEEWARQFLAAFAEHIEIFGTILKHPKFKGEVERRIAVSLQPGEHSQLEFRQKRTLLARHLPIDLASANGGKLPLTRIYVGPGPAQQVSKVSVGDLLLQCARRNRCIATCSRSFCSCVLVPEPDRS